MSITHQLWFLHRKDSPTRRIVVPLIAASGMLITSVLPWLRDPLGRAYNAWRLPVYVSWQPHVGILNYGLFCSLGALYAVLIAWTNWRRRKGSSYFVHQYGVAACLCALPLVFLLVQYLFADVQVIDQLAQHKVQVLLIEEHFDYGMPGDLVPIKPFLLDISTLYGRALLLLDQIGPGAIVPLLIAWMLGSYRDVTMSAAMPPVISTGERKRRHFLVLAGSSILLVILLRSPVGTVCEYAAKTALSTGAYTQSLAWLSMAVACNPELEQTTYYHLERGEALYYLHTDLQTDETRIYLAYAYRQQNDYLDAYSELLGSWHGSQTPAWVVSELDMTLEGLTEYTHPLKGPLVLRPAHDYTALPWGQLLIQVDPTNTFGHYLTGRIAYDLHSYVQCEAQMVVVTQQSNDADIESSALTYIGLSDIGLGNDAQGREVLFRAIALDPDYRNNTAREGLSGLR